MATKYLNVEFIVTIPVKIEVDDDIGHNALKLIARQAALREIERIEHETDGLINWITFSGTIEPMEDDDIELFDNYEERSL
jgi:hypothetical protein